MTVKIRAQANYYETEVSLEPTVDVGQIHELLKSTKTSGKLVILYNNGFIQGINVQQRERLSEAIDAKVKGVLGLAEKKL